MVVTPLFSFSITSPQILKQQAMKALKTTISVTELQKTLGLWKSRKITDSVIPKLLHLYLGMTAYMNQEKVYPVDNFYEISIALAFKMQSSSRKRSSVAVHSALYPQETHTE